MKTSIRLEIRERQGGGFCVALSGSDFDDSPEVVAAIVQHAGEYGGLYLEAGELELQVERGAPVLFRSAPAFRRLVHGDLRLAAEGEGEDPCRTFVASPPLLRALRHRIIRESMPAIEAP